MSDPSPDLDKIRPEPLPIPDKPGEPGNDAAKQEQDDLGQYNGSG